MALSATPITAVGQDNYPSSPVKIVLGFLPGATTDVVARLLAQKLAGQMNVNVVVENKPGANGNIGAEIVANSRPNGYTLLLNTSGVVLSQAFGEKLAYDVFRDLMPVGMVASAPLGLFVHPSLPVNTPAEFIAHAKANPDKLIYGSTGVGNITHLATLLFLQANGLTAVHVPYKGAPEAVSDLVAGRIQFAVQTLIAGLPMVKDKRIKAVAITGLKRSPLLPDVPSLNETVMPGFEMGSWFSIMAPAKTPPALVKKLNGEIVKAMTGPDMKSRLEQEGADPLVSSAEEHAAYMKSELDRWSKVIRSAGLKLQ